MQPSLALSLEPLHIWSKLKWQIDVDLMQQLREKAVLLEATWLRAVAKTQQAWLDDFTLHYPGIALVFFTIDFKKWALVVTPYVKYHKLTTVANNVFFPLRQDI